MKITIDTKEDSHEEIQHAMSLLKSLMSKNQYSNTPNIFESNHPSSGDADPYEGVAEPDKTDSSVNIFGNLFGNPSVSPRSDDNPVEPTPIKPAIEPPIMVDDSEVDVPEVTTY